MSNYLCPEAMTEFFEQGLKSVLANNHYGPAKRSTWTPATDDNEYEAWQYTGPMNTTKYPGDPPSMARTWHTFRHRNHPKYGRAYAWVRQESWGWDGWVKVPALAQPVEMKGAGR